MELRGVLGFKGERGYSAYEVAVQNGFEGTEQDWLATLGTSQHASKTSTEYITTQDNETELDLPSEYMPNDSLVDIYVDGIKIYFDRYTIDYSNKKIKLLDAIPNTGEKVEIVVFTFASNSLPIVETIDENSTNDTSPSTKSVYEYIKGKEDTQSAINKTVDNKISAIEDNLIFDITVIEVEEE